MHTTQQNLKTYPELLAELRARLGFATTGAGAAQNAQILASILAQSHDHVLHELGEHPEQQHRAILPTDARQYLHDMHDDTRGVDILPELIGRILAYPALTPSSQKVDLARGLNAAEPTGALRYRVLTSDNSPAVEGQPRFWGVASRRQFRIWPTPAEALTLAIEYRESAPRFSETVPECLAPAELVLLHALTIAKSHYRHPDAQIAMGAYQQLMQHYKSRRHYGARYFDGSIKPAPHYSVERVGDKHVLYL